MGRGTYCQRQRYAGRAFRPSPAPRSSTLRYPSLDFIGAFLATVAKIPAALLARPAT